MAENREESTAVNNSDYESENSEVYAFVDNETIDTSQPEIGIPKRQEKKKKGKKGKKRGNESSGSKKKKKDMRPPSPRTISSRASFAQIAKEIKAKRMAEMAHALAEATKKKKRHRVLREEEIYTDKDRAAAVNMGTSDIKQSLKLKEKLVSNYGSQIAEEGGDPATLLALGNNELGNRNLKIALNFLNQALKLNPDDKNGLVARSKCYLSLGESQMALKDAEAALLLDKTFVKAIYQKAEALYLLGDFEHSLMHYHRGYRLRPELESFRLGVQKAQEAIENTIGSTAGLRSRRREKTISSGCSSSKTGSGCDKSSTDKSSNETNDTKRSLSSLGSEKKGGKKSGRSKSAAPSVKGSSKRFFGELNADRLYLENLLKHPDLNCFNQDAANKIKSKAEEGVVFLKSRQEFWRQQKPNATSRISKN